MEGWLELARGPLFRFALGMMVLGLGRLVFLSATGIIRAIWRANDRRLPIRALLVATLRWLFPVQLGNRPLYSITSVLFHAGLIITPIFLAAHVALWERGAGIGWAGLSQHFADSLTLLTIIAGVGLMVGRVANRFSRGLSHFEDFALPPLLILPFITGFLAMHPEIHSLSYDGLMLAHALSGDLILVLIPFTKMAHVVLLPTAQLVGELGWRFPADQGEKVSAALGKGEEPV